MSAQFQQPAHDPRIVESLAATIEANKPSYLVTNLATEEPGSMGTPPPSRIASPIETSQGAVQSSDRVLEDNTSANKKGPWMTAPIGGIPMFSCLENLLYTSAIGQHFFFPETDYLPLTAQSPVHLGIGQETPAWIITHLGIIGEEKPSDKTKLGPGSLIRLHDATLAQLNMGFESPWVFGAVQGLPRREAGFHIFPMKVHLYTLTRNPHYIPIRLTQVAIPNHLLNLTGPSYPLQQCTLGQRFRDRIGDPLPPLRPWEWDMMWVHPEWRMIDKWLKGEEGWKILEILHSARHCCY